MILPDSFVENMHRMLGDSCQPVLDAIADEPEISIRLNPQKVKATLELDVVPWASYAYYLPERLPFTFDPLFHAGCYYVQEASSMFLEQVIRQYVTTPVTALDLCAAPGGKSTLLRSLLPDGSLLVSNELIPNRAQVLEENIIKWGHPDCVVTNNKPTDFAMYSGMFDIIAADVPCSGEGMFRKDSVAIAEWSESNVETCWRRGREIIAGCWPSLKTGGLLVYSTCTFNQKEDEENVLWICDELGAEVLPLQTHSDWGITGNLMNETPICESSFPVYHFFPGRTRGEGFFLAVLRKTAESCALSIPTEKKKKSRTEDSLAITKECRNWLKETEQFEWRIKGNIINVIPTPHKNIISALERNLHVIYAGINIAELKGNAPLPAQELAYSTYINKEAFDTCPISYDEALKFLRKESFTLPSIYSQGIILITYQDIPLGFVKNLGNRANNLYPSEWRIRTTHLSEKEVNVLHNI